MATDPDKDLEKETEVIKKFDEYFRQNEPDADTTFAMLTTSLDALKQFVEEPDRKKANATLAAFIDKQHSGRSKPTQ